MRVWQFSEMPYTPAWGLDTESLRVTLPNSNYDPKTWQQKFVGQLNVVTGNRQTAQIA